MSLINDAIKQASRARPPSDPPAAAEVQMQPVTGKGPFSWHLFLIPAGLGGVLVLGVLFLVKGWQASVHLLTPRGTERALPVVAREVPPTPVPAVRPVQTAPGPTNTPIESFPNNPSAPSAAPVFSSEPAAPKTEPPNQPAQSAAPATPDLPQAPSFPNLKLQGIYYRPANPSVVINSKTLYRGDKIEQAEVVEITKESVTVVWEGETKVLTLQ